MALQLSPVAKAPEVSHGDHFSARRLDLATLGRTIAPVMGFDHFRMSGPTFAPHPHAGFSAVSFIFEDSPGAIHNRDTLGHDLIAGPGDVVWTQAARGAIHDEVPAQNGVTVHGVQIFINLSAANKHSEPKAFHAKATAIPVARPGAGNRVRVASGTLDGVTGPLEPIEAFDMLDARLESPLDYQVKPGWNAMIYVVSGAVDVLAEGAERHLQANEAVGALSLGDGGHLRIIPKQGSHILLLSGQDSKEPIAVYGPFIMNSQSELHEAIERYQVGAMGHLA